MTPALSKKQALERWYNNPENTATLRSLFESPVLQQAIALTQMNGQPMSIPLSTTGEQTLAMNALGHAQQVGWNNGLLFLQKLTEPPAEKAPDLIPWGHLQTQPGNLQPEQ
jgi:hypothetical protein